MNRARPFLRCSARLHSNSIVICRSVQPVCGGGRDVFLKNIQPHGTKMPEANWRKRL